MAAAFREPPAASVMVGVGDAFFDFVDGSTDVFQRLVAVSAFIVLGLLQLTFCRMQGFQGFPHVRLFLSRGSDGNSQHQGAGD